jgi:phosphoenolpyruvate phosphomutase
LKVYHVVDAMARAGAAAVCIEDNPTSKRCSLYEGHSRTLASTQEHVSRILAALEGVQAADSPCRIIARTEALVAGLGVKEAHERATAYADAGAHAMFVQSLDATGGDVLEFSRRWNRRTPIFIAPTRFPQITGERFVAAGISHRIFANHGMRGAHAALEATFGALAKAESSLVVEKEISSVAAVAETVGAGKISGMEARFGNEQQNRPALARNGSPGRRKKRAIPA